MILVQLLFLTFVLGDGFINGGSNGIPKDIDCTVRKLAWEFGKKLLPQRKDFKT